MVLLQQRYGVKITLLELDFLTIFSDQFVRVRENETREFECELGAADNVTVQDGPFICISYFSCHTWEVDYYVKKIIKSNYTISEDGNKRAINFTVVGYPVMPAWNQTSDLNAIPIVNGSTLYCITGADNECGNIIKILSRSPKTYILLEGIAIHQWAL